MAASTVSEPASVPGETASFAGDPENPWGWLLVGTGFLLWFVVDGIVVSYAVILNHLMDEEEMVLLSWVGASARAHIMVIGIITGPLTKKFGCPLMTFVGCMVAFLGLLVSSYANNATFLMFSFGMFAGWGFSLAIMPSVFEAPAYFKRRKALAIVIVTCGSGAGPAVFAPLSQYVIDSSSWRNVFVMNSLICLMLGLFVANLTRPQSPRQTYVDNYNCCKSYLGSCIKKRTQSRIADETDVEANKISYRSSASSSVQKELQALKLAANPRWLAMGVAGFVTHLGLHEVPLFLPAYASANGIDNFSGAVLLSFFGIANTVGRIWVLWVKDKNWLPLNVAYISVLFTSALVTFVVPFTRNYPVLVLLVSLCGVCTGTSVAIRCAMIIENIGVHLFQDAFGIYLAAAGLGSAVGPPTVGYIFTATSNSYTWLFGVGASFLMAGFVMWSLLPFVSKLGKVRTSQTITENVV